jgi:tetratricopeptide (TPR) repeat protein
VAESKEQKIGRLMAEGLDLYGQDDVAAAIARWRAVLALDPKHEAAREYLEVAGAGAEHAAPRASAPNRAAEFLSEGLELIEQGSDAEALELVERATREAPALLEAQAILDLLRAHLHQRARVRTNGGAAVLRVKLGPQQIMRFNLPPNAGFVLSMIDGRTSADEIVALSAMDPFEAHHTLAKLLDAGIVEARA